MVKSEWYESIIHAFKETNAFLIHAKVLGKKVQIRWEGDNTERKRHLTFQICNELTITVLFLWKETMDGSFPAAYEAISRSRDEK